MDKNTTHLAGILRALTIGVPRFSVEETSALVALLQGQDGVVQEAQRLTAEEHAQRLANVAGAKSLTDISFPVGSTFTLKAGNHPDLLIAVNPGAATCTAVRYRMVTRNAGKVREMAFTFADDKGRDRTGWLYSPRMADIDPIVIAPRGDS